MSYLFASYSYSQDLKTTRTQYSRTENGTTGEESFSFTLLKNTLYIVDLDYKKQEEYGPLMIKQTGFEQGTYYVSYVPNTTEDPANWRKWNHNMRGYKLVFDKKGGNLLMVVELKGANYNGLTATSFTSKIYYTQEGYDFVNK